MKRKATNQSGFLHKKWLLIAAIAGVIHPTQTVWAQDAGGRKSLEEVVVTAERRDASVQDIPTSMTAMTAEQLEKKAVTRLDDLQFASPGLSVTHSRDRDSFYSNIGAADSDAGSLDETSARLGALWQPVGEFEVYAKYEKAEKSTGGYAYRPIATTAYAGGRTGNIRDLDYNTPTANDANPKPRWSTPAIPSPTALHLDF